MEFLLHKIGVVIVMFKFVTNFLSFVHFFFFENSNVYFFVMIFQFFSCSSWPVQNLQKLALASSDTLVHTNQVGCLCTQSFCMDSDSLEIQNLAFSKLLVHYYKFHPQVSGSLWEMLICLHSEILSFVSVRIWSGMVRSVQQWTCWLSIAGQIHTPYQMFCSLL